MWYSITRPSLIYQQGYEYDMYLHYTVQIQGDTKILVFFPENFQYYAYGNAC